MPHLAVRQKWLVTHVGLLVIAATCQRHGRMLLPSWLVLVLAELHALSQFSIMHQIYEPWAEFITVHIVNIVLPSILLMRVQDTCYTLTSNPKQRLATKTATVTKAASLAAALPTECTTQVTPVLSTSCDDVTVYTRAPAAYKPVFAGRAMVSIQNAGHYHPHDLPAGVVNNVARALEQCGAGSDRGALWWCWVRQCATVAFSSAWTRAAKSWWGCQPMQWIVQSSFFLGC